jgi:HK97 family phage major capsid protein
MNKRMRKRESGIRYLGLAFVLLAGVILLPAILAAVPGLLLAAPLFGVLRSPEGSGGGGGTNPMELTARALEALDTKAKNLEKQIGELLGMKSEITPLKEGFEGMKGHINELKSAIDELKKVRMLQGRIRSLPLAGEVSEECAREIASQFILHCERSGKLEALCSQSKTRESLLDVARATFGLSVKAAVTTTEIPLPTTYSGEIRELISQFGVVRRKMFHYPIGMGTARPARMGTRPAFGSIAMSGAFTEKVPTITFASLESHKLGGIVRLPREIDEQSVVAMGQFLARYGAVEFARAEDTWGFLADGTATYESVKGIVQIARDLEKTVVLAAGKTKPSDAALASLRALRRKVNKAALNGNISAYYLDTTWETILGSFNTEAEPYIYQRLPDGSARLDGYPIIWTDVLEPYGEAAAADKAIAVFGALSFWWLGEHGSPRIDTSEHVYFANDQLATRFIEEIDFDYCAPDATAVLLTAAA